MTYETRNSISEPILMTYPYGSRVYGSNREDSDHDFIIVVESDDEISYNVNYSTTDFTVYSKTLFIKKIKEHHIDVLECIFQKKNDPFVKYFKLNKEKLRRSISGVSSNSFVKCKKKLAQGDYLIGKKSLFHSLRILGFGTQIALSGRIIDYSAYNHYLDKIMEMNTNDWQAYKNVFQPVYNKRKSAFRILAPLEGK